MDAAEGDAAHDLPADTLDTLPINVAVLDEDGRIVFTNRAWREFGGGDPTRPPPEETGVNYLEAIDPNADGYARRALDGLRAVIAGEEAAFALEYPCHTPEERQWFLMRVTSFERDGETRVVVAHSDITERKLAELEAARRAAEVRRERRHLEQLVDRINGLLEDVTHGLVGAPTRGAVDELLTSRIVETEPYVAAWVAERDLAADRLVVRERAGPTTMIPDEVALDAEDDPAVAALDAESPIVLDPIEPDRAGWLADLAEAGVGSVAAFPLATRDVSYGVLVVGADRSGAFNERELAVLSALARAAASTVNAIEGRRILTSTAVIELELAVSDPEFPMNRLSVEGACPVTMQGSVERDDGSLLLFLGAETEDPTALLEAAAAMEAVESATVLTDHGEAVLLELALTESVVTAVAEFGGVTTALSAEDGVGRITVELPVEADARSVYTMLTERYPGTTLSAYRERERPATTRQGFESQLDERLTERQRTALRSAVLAGYFEWPRPVDGDTLAEAMDISRPTFHQHLRAAQRKVLSEFYRRD